ncbi:MAG: glucose-6-phosphate isomerase [Chloroflexota bacterium]
MSSRISNFHAPPDIELAVQECLSELSTVRFHERIWEHDTGLWRGDDAEMAQRLGWLHLGETMAGQLGQLERLREELVQEGYTDAVLLGMGGSSLGAEVVSSVLGRTDALRQHVLDSIVPEAVTRVRESVALERTVFIVSSKSGGTLEPNLLYEYFRGQVESETGSEHAGRHFIAVTDPGSSLETLAATGSFRRVFLNPPDIGGRYAVLSFFGLVPGALAGADIQRLHDSGAGMAQACRTAREGRDNPATVLGTYIGGCARSGRDKLTIITSPTLRSFGWWAEQLIAESTGKQGTGILPVVDEPPLHVDSYSSDRAFVYMRLASDTTADLDAHINSIAAAGHPCLTIDLTDGADIGAEFFRWEYAAACAGALLHIDPFNQPDVQRAKDAGKRVLEHYVTYGTLPEQEAHSAPHSLLAHMQAGSYLAVMAYVRRRNEMDAVVEAFRQRVGERFKVATTFGYGPRFLHSTGQLHKGGPPTGRFLQIVTAHSTDIPLPEQPYTFGVAADAQAQGDLEALKALGRPVARIRLDGDDADLMARALSEIC